MFDEILLHFVSKYCIVFDIAATDHINVVYPYGGVAISKKL
jgi:hypothetical protein